jgi:hypothetical protein
MFITMRRLAVLSVLAVGLTLGVQAGGVATYQATGPVLELTDAKIVIQKDDSKWEIARTADTKVTGDLKVGAKVTIKYTMTAATVAVKDK